MSAATRKQPGIGRPDGPMPIAAARRLLKIPGLVASPTTQVYHRDTCLRANGFRSSGVVPFHKLQTDYVSVLRPCGHCKPPE